MIDWSLIVAAVISAAVSYFVSRYINKKLYIYEIKKNTILKSMKFLDEYYAIKGKETGATDKGKDELTRECREIFNELALTFDKKELLEAFSKILFPENYGIKDPMFKLYCEYRNVCRKELGNKSELILSDDIAYIRQIDPEGEWRKENEIQI